MKPIAAICIVGGLAITIASVWISSVRMREDFRTEIQRITAPPNATNERDLTVAQMRDRIILARTKVDRALTNLRSIKTGVLYLSRSHTARATLEQARASISELQQRAEEMNSIALQVEEDTRDLLVSYDRALNRAAEEALKKAESSSGLLQSILLPALGGIVSVCGLFINWRSDRIAREKVKLEIQELQRKLNAEAIEANKAPEPTPGAVTPRANEDTSK
jgi:hypothetical protein